MTAVEQFQSATEQLASDTQQSALTLYGQYQVGQLDHADTALLLAALINRANASAVSLADVWLAIQIEEQTGQPVPTVGVLPKDHSERLVKAVNTVLSNETAPKLPVDDAANVVTDDVADNGSPSLMTEPDQAGNRIARLARAEPFEAAQQATHEAIQKQPLVEGWVRQMDADPCQLCKWWWREGRVWPKAHPMPRHKGCNCQQKVVVAQSIKSTQYTRNLERNT
ncbi:hypothetical protein [Mycolicibacterium sp. J2]|uniref:hypothetical protein n=1 Tax=Mycolicibacterium sp. J2 TaxID=2993511 RepID=UPI00224B446A|nr:hypothetical protein [Mycolicibacterium sp. J2]MCX2716083.1 hypothetical protein [Mycolicibacterium sp. J2]